MDDPILRATDAAGEVYDDPSEDALFMLMEDLTASGASFRVERVEVDRVVRPFRHRCAGNRLGQIAMRIKRAKAARLVEHEVQEKGRFSGAGLAGNVEVPSPLLGRDEERNVCREGGAEDLHAAVGCRAAPSA